MNHVLRLVLLSGVKFLYSLKINTVFALDLSLVFSEVYIPLTTQCLCASVLYLEGFVVFRDYMNHVCGVTTTLYQSNEDHSGLADSSIVKMTESDPRE